MLLCEVRVYYEVNKIVCLTKGTKIFSKKLQNNRFRSISEKLQEERESFYLRKE